MTKIDMNGSKISHLRNYRCFLLTKVSQTSHKWCVVRQFVFPHFPPTLSVKYHKHTSLKINVLTRVIAAYTLVKTKIFKHVCNFF